eukprot:1161180-Pelagomonas_calceolata.AAC.3
MLVGINQHAAECVEFTNYWNLRMSCRTKHGCTQARRVIRIKHDCSWTRRAIRCTVRCLRCAFLATLTAWTGWARLT